MRHESHCNHGAHPHQLVCATDRLDVGPQLVKLGKALLHQRGLGVLGLHQVLAAGDHDIVLVLVRNELCLERLVLGDQLLCRHRVLSRPDQTRAASLHVSKHIMVP